MNDGGIDRAFALAVLVMTHKRITVRRIMSELDIPRSTAYRLLDRASRHLPIRLERGVVCATGEELST